MFGAADRHAVFRQIARIGVLVVAAGVACAFLVTYAPGTMVDERELDRRLNAESIRELRSNKAPLSYANSDLSGFSIFEEAQYRGVTAAERALKDIGRA